MNNFFEDYNRARKFVSKEDIKRTKRFIESILVPYIKKLQEQNPNLSSDEFDSLLIKDAFDFAQTAFKSTFSFDYYMEFICCKYLQQHPKVLNELYNQFDCEQLSFDRNKFILSDNHTLNDYITRYLHSVIPAYKETLKEFEDIFKENAYLGKLLKDNNKSKEIENLIKKISNPIHKMYLKKGINYYTNGLIAYLPTDEAFIESKLKEILSSSISETAKQLTRLNLFEKYKEIELQNLQKLKIKDKIPNKKSADITNPELLKKLSIHDLMILNSFWINRYAKELHAYCNGMFAIYTLDILPKILNDSFCSADINSDYISEVLKKCDMLKNHSQLFIHQRQQDYITGKLPPDKYEKSEDGNYVTYSFIPFAKIMKQRYSMDYNKTFKNLPGNNNIEHNAALYGQLISPVINIYSTKDDILNALICNLDTNKEIVNAGIIPDSTSSDGMQITINSDFVCLGIDSPALNHSIKVHAKSYIIKDFLCQIQEDAIISNDASSQIPKDSAFIPLYEGNGDFAFSNGKLMTTPFVYPFTKEEKKFIMQLSNSNPENDFFKHMFWITKPSKVPDKYMSSYEDSKGRIKKCFKRRYINLIDYEPGKPLVVYVQDNKNQYIPASESGLTLPTISTTIPTLPDRR